jgi:hypothetical protein
VSTLRARTDLPGVLGGPGERTGGVPVTGRASASSRAADTALCRFLAVWSLAGVAVARRGVEIEALDVIRTFLAEHPPLTDRTCAAVDREHHQGAESIMR